MDNVNTSLIVKWLRLPMALLVIFIHMTPHLNSHFTPISGIDWQCLSPDNIYSIIGVFFNNLCTVAVPFFFFMIGSYLAVNKFDILDTFKNCKWIIIPSMVLLIVLVLIDNTPYATSVRHIYQIIAVIGVFPIANTVIKRLKYINQFIFKYSNASFFIYAIHTIPIVVTSPRGFANLFIDKLLVDSYLSGGCSATF